MSIALERAYLEAAPEDGLCSLVDRMSTRGGSREEAQLDQWLKEVAPSDDLRKSYHRGDLSWDEFRRCYLSDLEGRRDQRCHPGQPAFRPFPAQPRL